MKISKRFRILAVLLGGGIVVASSACSVDSLDKSTAPSAASHGTTPQRTSPFVPTAAQKALIGVTDGTYRVTFDPQRDQVFSLGPNRLEIPANAVCALGSSSYGAAFWNAPCTPEDVARSAHRHRAERVERPTRSVDFSPAMRFNPQTNVQLYIYVPERAARRTRRTGSIPTARTAVQARAASRPRAAGRVRPAAAPPVRERGADRSATSSTYVDYNASVLFRRLKHFSRYQVDGGYIVGRVTSVPA